jgi:hypothetical protein
LQPRGASGTGRDLTPRRPRARRVVDFGRARQLGGGSFRLYCPAARDGLLPALRAREAGTGAGGLGLRQRGCDARPRRWRWPVACDETGRQAAAHGSGVLVASGAGSAFLRRQRDMTTLYTTITCSNRAAVCSRT